MKKIRMTVPENKSNMIEYFEQCYQTINCKYCPILTYFKKQSYENWYTGKCNKDIENILKEMECNYCRLYY